MARKPVDPTCMVSDYRVDHVVSVNHQTADPFVRVGPLYVTPRLDCRARYVILRSDGFALYVGMWQDMWWLRLSLICMPHNSQPTAG